MIIITKKLHPRRLVAGCALFALALGVLGAGLGLVRDIQSAAAVADLQVDPRGIKTNADRVAFLEGYGWIVSQEPAAVEDIRLPDTFDASYDEYLSLQKSQGFDLSQYAGKTVKRYTYQVSKKRSSAGRSTPTRGTASSRPCPTPPKPERVPPANNDNAARRYPTVGGVSAPHSAGGAPQHPPGGAGQPVHGPGV